MNTVTVVLNGTRKFSLFIGNVVPQTLIKGDIIEVDAPDFKKSYTIEQPGIYRLYKTLIDGQIATGIERIAA